MNQNRHIWLLAMLSFITIALYSQQDSRADKYLQAVSMQFDLNKAYVIHMDYIREDLMQETSAEGEVVIWMKGLKYKIVLDEYIVYYNEDKLYSQNTETEEVYVSEPDPDQPGYLQAVPIKIIKAYEQDFNYMYIGNSPMLGKSLIEIQLYPKDISGPYSMLKMFVNPNSLLVRAGALYHDIGKMENPHFFIENLHEGSNPHNELDERTSAKLIIAHVLKGVEIAKKHNLNETIIDFIRTHHGTGTVQYFYRTYLNTNPDEEVDINEFTYPGPKPASKENAVLMMADSVEAASRTLKAYTRESISDLVENIISRQAEEEQFSEADITFGDISTIKEIFMNRLANIYHSRIEYPE